MRACVLQQPLRRNSAPPPASKGERSEQALSRACAPRHAELGPAAIDAAAATAVALERAVHLEAMDWRAASPGRSWCRAASPFAQDRSRRRRCPPARPAAPRGPPPSPSSDSAVVGGLARLVHVRLVAASWCRRSSRPRSAHQRLLGDARLTQSGRAGFGVAATRQKIGDRRVGAGRSEARQYASWVALAKQKAMVEAAVRAMQLHRLRPALGQGLEI